MSGTKDWRALSSAPGVALVQAVVLAASFACILPGLLLSCVILAVHVVTAHGWGLLLAFTGEAMARPALLSAASIAAGVTLVALLVWWPRLLHGMVFAAGMVSAAINFVATPSMGGDDTNWAVIGLGLIGTFIAALAVRRAAGRTFQGEAAATRLHLQGPPSGTEGWRHL